MPLYSYIFALNVLTFSSNSLFSSFSCRDFIANSSSSFLKSVHQNFVNSQYQCADKLTSKLCNENPFFFVVNSLLFLREQLTQSMVLHCLKLIKLFLGKIHINKCKLKIKKSMLLKVANLDYNLKTGCEYYMYGCYGQVPLGILGLSNKN